MQNNTLANEGERRMATWKFLTRCRICFAIGIKCSVNFNLNPLPRQPSGKSRCGNQITKNSTEMFSKKLTCHDALETLAHLSVPVPSLFVPISIRWLFSPHHQQISQLLQDLSLFSTGAGDRSWVRHWHCLTTQIKNVSNKTLYFSFFSVFLCELNTCSPSSTPGYNFSGIATIFVGSTAARGNSQKSMAH